VADVQPIGHLRCEDVKLGSNSRIPEISLPNLLQLGVLHLGFYQNENVRVGAFPKREEILICRLGFGGVALHGIRAGQAEVRKRFLRCKAHDTCVIADFLEFGSGF
jgi:hypothetical protein